MNDFEKWDTAVKNLRTALLAEWKTIAVFLLGFTTANLITLAIWLIAPERFCYAHPW